MNHIIFLKKSESLSSFIFSIFHFFLSLFIVLYAVTNFIKYICILLSLFYLDIWIPMFLFLSLKKLLRNN